MDIHVNHSILKSGGGCLHGDGLLLKMLQYIQHKSYSQVLCVYSCTCNNKPATYLYVYVTQPCSCMSTIASSPGLPAFSAASRSRRKVGKPGDEAMSAICSNVYTLVGGTMTSYFPRPYNTEHLLELWAIDTEEVEEKLIFVLAHTGEEVAPRSNLQTHTSDKYDDKKMVVLR